MTSYTPHHRRTRRGERGGGPGGRGAPTMSTLEGWLALASKVGATAVLGVACWVLWKQLRREQEDNIRLRDKYTTDLTGVIDRNTKVIERVEEVIRKCGGH
jgi:ABC-type nickel/cobalt efflux system permease component RcnA